MMKVKEVIKNHVACVIYDDDCNIIFDGLVKNVSKEMLNKEVLEITFKGRHYIAIII